MEIIFSHLSSMTGIPARRQLWAHLFCVVLLLTCGAAVRLRGLNNESLWLDEFTTWNEMERCTLTDYLAQLRMRDATFVPAYYVALYGWAHCTNHNVYAARLLSVGIGMATLLLTYAFALRMFNPTAGITALALAALSPIHVYYTQEIRVYALYALAALLSAYTLHLALERGRWPIWAMHHAANLILVFTHYFGALFLLTEGACLLLFHRSPKKRLLVWFIIQTLFAFLLGFWMLGIRRDVLEMTTAFLVKPAPEALEYVASWAALYWPRALYDQIALTRMVPAILLLLLFYCWWTRNHNPQARSRWEQVCFCVGFMVLPVLLILAMTFWVRPAFTIRYVLPASLPFFILLGGAAGCIPFRPLRWGAAGLLIGLVAFHTLESECPFRPNMLRAGLLVSDVQQSDHALLLSDRMDEDTRSTYLSYPEERLHRCPSQYDAPDKVLALLEEYAGVLMVCVFDYGRGFYSDEEKKIDADLRDRGIQTEKIIASDHHYTFITNQNWPAQSDIARRVVVYRMQRRQSGVLNQSRNNRPNAISIFNS